ncbi:MAG: DUF2079 domain-containing protein [Candidatus Nanopelagicales bacterium]
MSRRDRAWAAAPFVVSTAAFVLYAVYSVSRHAQFETAGHDLGIFAVAVQKYAAFQLPVVPLQGLDTVLLGDHFHPILAALAPLWWVAPTPVTLLVAQAALVAASILPVWRFTARRLTPPQTLLVAVGYALSWPLQAVIDYDFHEVAFAVPIIAWTIDLVDRERYGPALAVGCTLLLVREDMFLVVLMLGLLLLLRRRYALAATAVGAAVAGYVIAVLWVIPAFAPSGTYRHLTLGAFGPDLPSALAAMMSDPVRTLTTLVTPDVKWQTLLWLFAPLAFLSLGSPYVLLALPLVVTRFFSEREELWTHQFHYSATVAPILVLAAVDTVARLAQRFDRLRFLSWALPAVMAVTAVVGTVAIPSAYPFHRLVVGDAFERTAHMDAMRAALDLIPTGVCVEADDRALPHLTRNAVVTLPGTTQGLATWMLLDLTRPDVGWRDLTPESVMRDALGDGFRVVSSEDGIVVLHREGPVDPRCAVDVRS